MPHFTIEYSANLDARVDMGKLVELVRTAAVETGMFPLGGIRVRAIRCQHHAIATGEPEFAFLDWCCDSARDAISQPARRPANTSSMPCPATSTRFSRIASWRCRSTCKLTTRKPAGSETTFM